MDIVSQVDPNWSGTEMDHPVVPNWLVPNTPCHPVPWLSYKYILHNVNKQTLATAVNEP